MFPNEVHSSVQLESEIFPAGWHACHAILSAGHLTRPGPGPEKSSSGKTDGVAGASSNRTQLVGQLLAVTHSQGSGIMTLVAVSSKVTANDPWTQVAKSAHVSDVSCAKHGSAS